MTPSALAATRGGIPHNVCRAALLASPAPGVDRGRTERRVSTVSFRQRRTIFALCSAAVFGAGLFITAGCKASERTPSPREDALVVYAATSLREAFTKIGNEFRRAHPRIELTFNFAGTQELRTQLDHGASVDVFASADRRHMEELVRASRVKTPVIFAHNELVVVVAKESANAIRSLAELPNAYRIVIGMPEVPIGRYTLQLLDRARDALGADFRSRVEARVVSRELNVSQVLNKVSLGEAEAGIVYQTDAQRAFDRVAVVSIPAPVNVRADYPIAVVTEARHPILARSFVELVVSPRGQQALREAGFMSPATLDTSP